MKRTCLAILLLLAIPLFTGFSCRASTSPDPGDPCRLTDINSTECTSENTLRACDESTGRFETFDCDTVCGGEGSCGYESSLGHHVCVCDDAWELGGTCSVYDGWDTTECQNANSEAWYCDASTGLVSAYNCNDYCGGSGSCGYDNTLGYNWCICDDAWYEGAACNYWSDYPDASVCYGADMVLYCAENNTVTAWDCNDACGDSYGYCAYDSSVGADWCLCEQNLWEPGYPCNYVTEYDDATCDGDTLTYCSETDVIGAISCADQCADWYGAGVTGTCGTQLETGYNGCVCEFTGCDFQPYCNDAIYLVWCDGTDAQWLNCDEDCRTQGYSKGVCDFSSSPNACQCG